MESEYYLGLGSNMGDKFNNIIKALYMIREASGSLNVSGLYETRPEGFTGQPHFVNAVCQIWCKLDSFELMEWLKKLQLEFGDTRSFLNGPRILDIDILISGSLVIQTPSLTIPHPRMFEREFVLRPLSEIAPSLRHPIFGVTVIDLLNRLTPSGEVHKVRQSLQNGVLGFVK